MTGLEVMVTLLAVANGLVVLVRPMGRLHARLDVLDERTAHLIRTLDRLLAERSKD